MKAPNWHKSYLASVVSTLESGSRPKGGASTETGEVASLGRENIVRSGGVTLAEVKRVPHAFFERMTKGHLADGDVIINKDGAQTGKVGIYLGDGTGPACINEHVFLIRGDKEQICQNFLYYTLLSEHGQRQITAQISGSAQPGLKSSFLKGVVTDIPDSLSEQATIAKILSTMDRAIEQTEALIAKQQRIKTGLTQDLLTLGVDEHGNLRSERTHEFKDSPLGKIPAEWEVKELGHLVDEPITYGIVQAGPHVEDGVPYIRTGDMSEGVILLSELLRTSSTIAKSYKRSEVHVGDIVFALRATVGKVLPVSEELHRANLTQGTAKISPIKSVDSNFLLWSLGAFRVQQQIRVHQKGTTFMEITLRDLRGIMVALPANIEEQRLIGDVLSKHDSMIGSCERNLIKLRSLKTALMQDLLTGRKRVTPLLESEPKPAKMYASA
jgi:type I restriction enzyme S subunit